MGNEKNIKNFLSWYFIGGLCSFFLLYIGLQYINFKTSYNQYFLKESTYTSQLLQNILENYKTTLEKISVEIKEKNLFSDQKSIAECLEKAYAYGVENANKEKMRVSGLNWIGISEKELNPVGRFGDVKYKLTFTPEYLKKLENQREIVEAVSYDSDPPLINIGFGVRDGKDKYRGFVNARIDLNILRDTLLSNKENGFHFILLDTKGNEILSSLLEEEPSHNSLEISQYFIEIFESVFASQQYTFPLQLSLKDFPYVLRFGYEKKQMYMLFFKQNYFSFALVFFIFFVFSLFSYFYHKRFIKKSLWFYEEKSKETHLTINQLTEENQTLKDRGKALEKYIKSFEESDKEERKFCLEINKRISSSLSKMLDISNFLLTRIQEEHQIEEESTTLMEVFENTYMHSRFFTLKKEEDLVSINDVLEESLVILSKHILRKELYIHCPRENIAPLLTDGTALKQAILNILGKSIKNSPKKGEIHLSLFTQGEEICFECRDNGYLGENSIDDTETTEEKPLSLDCMSLESQDIEKLIKSLGGTLSSTYKPYKGNTFLLQLPSQMKNERDGMVVNSDNIVSFPNLRKKFSYDS